MEKLENQVNIVLEFNFKYDKLFSKRKKTIDKLIQNKPNRFQFLTRVKLTFFTYQQDYQKDKIEFWGRKVRESQ